MSYSKKINIPKPCKCCGRPIRDRKEVDTCSDECAVTFLSESFTLWPTFAPVLVGRA